MNAFEQLQSLGLVLPSPTYIVASIAFGIVSVMAFRRGCKESRSELIWLGVALMVYPYAVSQTWLLRVIGAALCGWLYLNGIENSCVACTISPKLPVI